MLAFVLLALGAVLVVAGCALLSPALALIVAGLAIAGVALLMETGGDE